MAVPPTDVRTATAPDPVSIARSAQVLAVGNRRVAGRFQPGSWAMFRTSGTLRRAGSSNRGAVQLQTARRLRPGAPLYGKPAGWREGEASGRESRKLLHELQPC